MECAACGTDDELVYRCERCLGIFCATHHDHRYHDCRTTLAEPMASDADVTDESAFLWGEHLSPTRASEWIWGSADDGEPTETAAREASSDTQEVSPPRESATEPGDDQETTEAVAESGVGGTAPDPGDAKTAIEAELGGMAADPGETEPSPAAATSTTSVSSPSTLASVDGPDVYRHATPQEMARPGYGPEPFSAEPVGPPTTFTEWLHRQTYLSLTVKVGIVASLFNLLAYSLIAVAMVLSLG